MHGTEFKHDRVQYRMGSPPSEPWRAGDCVKTIRYEGNDDEIDNLLTPMILIKNANHIVRSLWGRPGPLLASSGCCPHHGNLTPEASAQEMELGESSDWPGLVAAQPRVYRESRSTVRIGTRGSKERRWDMGSR